MKKLTMWIMGFGLACLMMLPTPIMAERGKDSASQPASAPVSPANEGRRRYQPEPRAIRAYSLKYADPQKVAEIIKKTAIDGKFVPMEGKIVVHAIMSEFGVIEQILAILDVPPKPQPERDIEFIKLDRSILDKVADSLSEIAPDIKFILDYRVGALLFDKSVLTSNRDLLESLINEIRHSEFNSQADKNYLIRVVWLISGESQFVPADLKDVIEEMAAMGVVDLGVAAQSTVQTSVGKFSIVSTPDAFPQCQMAVKGEVLEAPSGLPRLQLEVDARGEVFEKDSPDPPTSGPRPPRLTRGVNQLAYFKTNLTAISGQRIVLGGSQIGGRDSVFVIQVLERKPGKTPEKVPGKAAKPSAPAKGK